MRIPLLTAVVLALGVNGWAAKPVSSLPGVADAGREGSIPAANEKQAAVLKQLRLLNQVPEEQINERMDPVFSILRALHDTDGPEFSTLRDLLRQAKVRSSLNPAARVVVAGIVSQRWDTFPLVGNLWLSGLRSINADLRAKARRKLVNFIQPAHIPELIEMLRVPGPNVLAYEVLQETTGQSLDPDVRAWRRWWAGSRGKVDIVGQLLKDTRQKLKDHPIRPFEHERFWYAPAGVRDAHFAYSKRSRKERDIIGEWVDWANQDVKRYIDGWSAIKPVLDRVTHQPDPRVNVFLESLVSDPGYGDYASIVLAWRASMSSLPEIQAAWQGRPTVGRALARGSLGDPQALEDLLRIIGRHAEPLAFSLMNDEMRQYSQVLHTVGVLPAERAFELLSHRVFDFEGAATRGDKKACLRKASRWLRENRDALTLDKRRGYYVVPQRNP